MSDDEKLRSWQEIVEEASHARDPDRLVELAKELEQSLDSRDKKKRPPSERGQSRGTSTSGW